MAQRFAVGPWNPGERGRRNHEVARIRREFETGRSEMHMHVMRIQRESPIRRQVYTLPDGNGFLSHGVEFHAQDQDMGMFRERLIVLVYRTPRSYQRP